MDLHCFSHNKGRQNITFNELYNQHNQYNIQYHSIRYCNSEHHCRNKTDKRSKIRNDVGNTKDRKSTRLNSSHVSISYAVFCLKKKRKTKYVSEANNAG